MGLFTCVFAWISSATKLLSKLLSGCYELSPEAANSSLIPMVAGADLEVAVLGVEDQSPKVRMKVVLSFFFLKSVQLSFTKALHYYVLHALCPIHRDNLFITSLALAISTRSLFSLD